VSLIDELVSAVSPSLFAKVYDLMCGIFATISRGEPVLPDEHACHLLEARGPDCLQTLSIALSDETSNAKDVFALTCCSSVLALRGDQIQKQPLVDEKTGSILCWNGEAWKIDGKVVDGNDSAQVFQALLVATAQPKSSTALITVLTSIAGPYAFVFYDATSSIIYYGRDRLGRRSLLLESSNTDSLTLSSVRTNPRKSFVEVDTTALHAIHINDGRLGLIKLDWPHQLPSINLANPVTALAQLPAHATMDSLLGRLSSALRLRVLNVPTHSRLHPSLGAARIAILFSGGLDCTLLARLTHQLLPEHQSVDLLNVAFENPRTMKGHPSGTSPFEICPDRITGRASFAELAKVCSARNWRFVAIDISREESLQHGSKIADLMSPHNTEMDLSIAMALYFAARGIGNCTSSINTEAARPDYETTARVLLSGLGADELFGGYSRHAAAFSRGGFEELVAELDLDYRRIGQRNLGRDDRVISHWGKETRFPFLDEDFVAFALGLPIWEKCGYRLDRVIPKHHEDTAPAADESELDPAKMLLRVAAWRLGMKRVAAERKRAIQFGSRTAKMEAGRTKGTDAVR
jgi:asparagine synthetase B (glutamine-hydrolysing)